MFFGKRTPQELIVYNSLSLPDYEKPDQEDVVLMGSRSMHKTDSNIRLGHGIVYVWSSGFSYMRPKYLIKSSPDLT